MMKEYEGYKRNDTLASMYDDPALRMLRIGKECGCKFTVGTDSHGFDKDLDFTYTYLLTSLLDLTEDDLHIKTR